MGIENLFERKRVIVANRIFFIGFICIMAGILSSFLIYSSQYLFASVVIASIVCVALFIGFKKNFKRLLICLICLLLGVVSFSVKTIIYESNKIDENITYNVTGHISDIVYYENGYTRLVLNDTQIKSGDNIVAGGKISMVVYGMLPDYGDVISFKTKLENIELNEFGNFAYNPTIDIFYSAKISNYEVKENYFKIDELIRYSVKDKIESNFNSSESAGLAYAVMFGDKQILDVETESAFKKVGVTHLIAVSGLNISILFICIMWVINRITNNRLVLFISVSSVILFYVWLCGFAPSVTRAGLMCIIYCLSKCTLSRYDVLNSMGLAGLIILILSPYQLFNVGFILSFACIFGIVALEYIFNRLFKFLDFNNILKTSIVTCLSAQMITFAVTAWCYGSVSLIGLLANVLLVPLFEFIFIALVVVLIISFIVPVNFLYSILNFGFNYTINISKFLAQVQLAETNIFKITSIGCLICLVICFIVSDKLLIKKSVKCVCSMLLLVVVVFTSLIGNFNMLKGFNVTPLGESNLVLVANSYDMSILNFDMSSLYDLNKYLFNTNTYNVDSVVIISEYDVDYDGFKEFAIEYGLKNIYVADNVYNNYERMFNFINLDKIKINIISNGDEFNIGLPVKYYRIDDEFGCLSIKMKQKNLIYYNGNNIGDIEVINTLFEDIDYLFLSETFSIEQLYNIAPKNLIIQNIYYEDYSIKNSQSYFTINI